MILVLSIGGSVIDHDRDRLAEYAGIFRDLGSDHTVFVVVGGGATARDYIGMARSFDADEVFCDLLGIDPLGLIGSGSLLICCQKADCDRLIDKIRKAAIEITVIGEVLAPGDGVQALRNGQSIVWPEFAADEITRLL